MLEACIDLVGAIELTFKHRLIKLETHLKADGEDAGNARGFDGNKRRERDNQECLEEMVRTRDVYSRRLIRERLIDDDPEIDCSIGFQTDKILDFLLYWGFDLLALAQF